MAWLRRGLDHNNLNTVALRALRSQAAPIVRIDTPDEKGVFETAEFQWRGSFSHLFDGKEAIVPPSWVVPPCSSLPTAASFLPCQLFCAADAPAIYADFERLAKNVDPFTTGDFRAETVDAMAADRNTSSPNQRNASFELTRELRFGVVRASTCSLNHRVVAVLSVQNARASKGNYPPTQGGDVRALPDWFECRAPWKECVEASPSLTLTNQHGLTIWNAAGRGEGRGFPGHETSTFRVPRMIMVGSVADISRALSNVTFQATRAHIGSNVVRLRVRDEASPFDFRESPDIMWRFDSLYRWEAWELQDCKAFCGADPLCFGFQWLEPNAAAVSNLQTTLSLLGPFQYSSGAGAFSFNGQAGEGGFPKCFFLRRHMRRWLIGCGLMWQMQRLLSGSLLAASVTPTRAQPGRWSVSSMCV